MADDSSGMNESPKESPKPGSLVVPPHGRGAIKHGSQPGGPPGPGRPPSAIRHIAREAFADRIPILTRIADKDEAKDADRIRAVETLGKFGLNKQIDVDDVNTRLRSTLDLLERELGAEHYRRLYPLLKEIWK